MHKYYPFYIANQSEQPNSDLAVTDKYSGEVATRVARADAADIDRAIAAAVEAAPAMAAMKPYQREAVLRHCIRRFRERFDELADLLRIEAGKPIADSRGEVERLIDTFEIAAREAQNPNGEVLNLEIGERTAGYRGFTKRVPVGPLLLCHAL